MADYHAVLRKAISGLETNSGEARRAIYEKARNALVNQLKAIDPPLSPSEITKQRLGLEEAIRKIEAEAASAALAGRKVTAEQQGGAAETPAEPVPEVAPEPKIDAGEAPAAAEEAEPAPAIADEVPIVAEDEAAATAAPGLPKVDDVKLGTGAASSAASSADFDRGMSALQQAARDAEIGEAAAPPPDRAAAGESRAEPRFTAGAAAPPSPGKGEDGRHIPVVTGASAEDRAVAGEGRRISIVLVVILVLIGVGLGAMWWQKDALIAAFNQTVKGSEDTAETPQTADPDAPAPDKITDRLPVEGEPAATEPPATEPPATETASSEAPGEPATAATDEPVPSTGAAQDPQAGMEGTAADTPPPAATAPDQATIAQQAILYEEGAAEDPNKGLAFPARALWELTTEPGSGQSDDTVIRCTVEVPGRGLRMAMTIRKNTDTALPASHLVELLFDYPSDFPGGGISSVPGIILKTTEQERGEALRGAAARVANGFFWIALADGEKDIAANLALLKERSWFDIPALYDNGKRAILTIEKGPPGERVFAEAFAAWSG